MNATDYAEPAVRAGEIAMPLLGFGTWQVSNADAARITAEALDVGYRHLDTATMYRNEAGIGQGLAGTGLPRDAVFVTTKLPPGEPGRERRTIEQSLTDLGLDHVDLWLVHWPPDGRAAPEVWTAFVEAQRDGLATAIGVSNYSLDQIDELTAATGVTPAVNQIRWSPARYHRVIADGHAERGVVLEGYSPFKASNLRDPALTSIADAHQATPGQIIVAWHIAHRFVVIPKSAQRDRMEANAAAVHLDLNEEEVAALDGLGRGDA